MEEQMPGRHLGHVFIECMRQYPDAVCQIDAATGKEETNASVLSRSIRLAKCFRKFGLKPGDVLSLGGRNHLDLYIPFYAALLNGLPISGVDPYFKYDEIKTLLTITKPKIAFCQQETYDYYVKALEDIGLETKILTFDGESSMKTFMDAYSFEESDDDFEPVTLDVTKHFAFLTNTSGTTGGLKVAAFTYEVVMGKLKLYKDIGLSATRSDYKISMSLSPVQWVSGFINALTLPMEKLTKLQTSKPDDEDHILEMINKYKPVSCLVSPSLMSTLIRRKDDVDLSCFYVINIAGSKVYPDVLKQFQALLRKGARVLEAYGFTEIMGLLLFPTPETPLGSCGVVVPPNIVKLVDPESGKEITEPYITGEILIKGPCFKEYYNDPEATAKMFTEDGFCKSGDLLYRDENNFYYFVDRMKSLIKYRGSHVLPAELETVILQHPGVKAVCVCGVPHQQDGQRAGACVVVKDGCHVTEDEIKDLVAGKLSKNKQLHGGVVFLKELPMTSTGKVAQGKIQELLKKTLGDA